MPISLKLIWFGVLGPQNRVPSLGVSLEIKLGQQSQRISSRVNNKYHFIAKAPTLQKFFFSRFIARKQNKKVFI